MTTIKIKEEVIPIVKSGLAIEENIYRFRFMNGNNRLIYRWDSAPHHITSFPFHLHTPEGVRECEKVNLIEVFEIVNALMSKREND